MAESGTVKGKTGLVVEGGGTKIAYTGGVLQCFLEQGIDIPYCVGSPPAL